MAALVWNSLLAGYAILHGGVNWENPSDAFVGYYVIFSIFVIAYLASTSVIGFRASRDPRSQKEKTPESP
jgi:hypothetical protein